MSDVASRFAVVAGDFSRVAAAVPADAWDRPAPPVGWVARDVVRHMVEWMPGLLAGGADVDIAVGPSAHDDPVGAWAALANGLQAVLVDDAESRPFSHPRAGDHPLDQAIAMFILGDVLVHTWDLAVATGQSVTLAPDEVAAMVAGLEAMGDALAQSGQYGPAVNVPNDRRPQTKLIALTGRNPNWQPT